MKKDIALAIVDGWQKDTKVFVIRPLVEYLTEVNRYIPFTERIRAVVGEHNRLASDAFWDGKFNLGAAMLMKYGFEKRRATTRPKRREASMGSPRLSGDFRNPKSDWKYVK